MGRGTDAPAVDLAGMGDNDRAMGMSQVRVTMARGGTSEAPTDCEIGARLRSVTRCDMKEDILSVLVVKANGGIIARRMRCQD